MRWRPFEGCGTHFYVVNQHRAIAIALDPRPFDCSRDLLHVLIRQNDGYDGINKTTSQQCDNQTQQLVEDAAQKAVPCQTVRNFGAARSCVHHPKRSREHSQISWIVNNSNASSAPIRRGRVCAAASAYRVHSVCRGVSSRRTETASTIHSSLPAAALCTTQRTKMGSSPAQCHHAADPMPKVRTAQSYACIFHTVATQCNV